MLIYNNQIVTAGKNADIMQGGTGWILKNCVNIVN